MGTSGPAANTGVGVPYHPDALASDRRKIYVSLILAFLIYELAQIDPLKIKGDPTKTAASDNTKAAKVALKNTNLWAWAVVLITLTVMSDFDTFADLAVAFAVLIFIVTAFNNGESAFTNLTNFQKINEPAHPATNIGKTA